VSSSVKYPDMNETEDKLIAALQGEDELGVVVRAHIHIEYHLVELVELFFQYPEYLKKMELEFHQKVDLALACGLKIQFAPPLKVLGNLRNDFAHKLNSYLGKQEVNNLYQSFSGEDKEIIQAAYLRTEKQVQEPTKKKFKVLEPRDQFILMVVTLRAALLVAITEVRKLANGT